MFERSKLDPTIVQAAIDAEALSHRARQILGQHILDSMGIRVGGHVRDRSTGFIYRVESGHVGSVGSEDEKIMAYLLARRVYKTGREDAHLLSSLSLSEVEPFDADAD